MFYQEKGTMTTGITSFTATSTSANAGDWYYYSFVPTTTEKKYPNWLQPNDTSGTVTTSMKYCWHCRVYYFNDLHTCYHCCCCQHHHYHNHWDQWIVT